MIQIGSDANDFLRIIPSGRTHDGADDYWDANWLDTRIEIAVGAFQGRYTACLRVDELIRFRDQLIDLHETLEGHAEFKSMENWLDVKYTGDGLGHFEIQCIARDDSGFGNTLEFTLHCDQTEVPGTIRELNGVLEIFPLVGDRDA